MPQKFAFIWIQLNARYANSSGNKRDNPMIWQNPRRVRRNSFKRTAQQYESQWQKVASLIAESFADAFRMAFDFQL